MQKRQLHLLLAIIVILIITIFPVRQYIKTTILETYPIQFDSIDYLPGRGLRLSNVRYTDSDITFSGDIVVAINPLKVAAGLGGVRRIEFIRPFLSLHAQQPLSLDELYHQIFRQKTLANLPNLSIRIFQGTIELSTASEPLEVNLDVKGELANVWDIYGTINDWTFGALVTMEDGIPQQGRLSVGEINQFYGLLDLTGEIALEVSFQHTGEEFPFAIEGLLTSNNLRYRGREFEDITAYWQYGTSGLVVDYLKAHYQGAELTASGGWAGDKLTTFGSATGVDFSLLAQELSSFHPIFSDITEHTSGKVAADWTVTGRPDNLAASYSLKVASGTILDNPISGLEITGVWENGRLVGKGHWWQANRLQTLGGWLEDKELEIVAQVNIPKLILPQQYGLDGGIAGEIVLAGYLDNPRLAGHLKTLSGEIMSTPFTLDSQFHWENQKLQAKLQGEIARGQVWANGQWDFSGKETYGELGSLGVKLEMLPLGLPNLAGAVDFSGILTDNGRMVSGDLQVADLRWGSYQFVEVVGSLSVDQHRAIIHDLSLLGKQTQYQLLGEIPWEPFGLDLHVKLVQGRMQEVFPLIGIELNPELDGILEGYMYLTGPIKGIEGTLFLELVQGAVADFELTGSLDLDIFPDHTVIHRLRLLTPEGQLLGRGTVSRQELDIFLDMDDISLEILESYWGLAPMSGLLSLQANLQGPIEKLTGESQIVIRNGKSQGVSLDTINANLLFNNGQLTLEPLKLRKANVELVAEGTLGTPGVPLNRAWAHIPLAIQVTIPQANLTPLQGRIVGNLSASGTLGSPLVYGRVSVGQLGLAIPYIDKVDKSSFLLEFAGEDAHLTGELSVGRKGRAVFDGLLNLTDRELELTMQALQVPLVSGALQGNLHGEAQLMGPWRQLQLIGQLQIDKARYSVLSSLSQQGGALAYLPPSYSLEFVSPNLQIVGPGIDLSTEGRLMVEDSGVRGEIRANGGTLSYLGTAFTVDTGRLEFAEWRDVPWLELYSQAQVDQLTITMETFGEISNLNYRFTSEPPLSEDELLQQLNWPRTIQRLYAEGVSQDDFWKLMADQAGRLMGGMERAVRNSLDLDLFRIEPDLYSRDVDIAVGKYVWENIYLGYSRNFLGVDNQEVLDLTYTLTPELTINTRLDSNKDRRVTLEFRNRF